MEGTYPFIPGKTLEVTPEIKQKFDENGYIMVRSVILVGCLIAN